MANMPRSRAHWLIGSPNDRIVEPVAKTLMGSPETGKAREKLGEETDAFRSTPIETLGLKFVVALAGATIPFSSVS